MRSLYFTVLCFMFALCLKAQTSTSFELRYYKPDPKANGETDFKGETSVFTVEERVKFLRQYTNFAAGWFDDANLNTKVVGDIEVQDILKGIKPLPLPETRKRVPLTGWKYISYRAGQNLEQAKLAERWTNVGGGELNNGGAVLNNSNAVLNNVKKESGVKKESVVELKEGSLIIKGKDRPVIWTFSPQAWRFNMSWQAIPVSNNDEVRFTLSDRLLINALTVGFGSNGQLFYLTAQGKRVDTLSYQAGKKYEFKVEVDLSGGDSRLGYGSQLGCYNLYIDEELIADFVPIERAVLSPDKFSSLAQVNTLSVHTYGEVKLDNILGFGYALTNRMNYPYLPTLLIDENFEIKPHILGWEQTGYDDKLWNDGELPVVVGSERCFQEDLYLRKELYINDFEQVFLNVETIDPGGEIWINNQLVASIEDRYPHKIDISSFLKRNSTNIIAVKVNHFYLTKETGEMMVHTSLDFNVGWFCGRMSLDFVSPSHIEDVYVHTLALKSKGADLKTKIKIKSPEDFEGKAIIEVFPWFPVEKGRAVAKREILLSVKNGNASGGEHLEFGTDKSMEIIEQVSIQNPMLWTPENPVLYKVKVSLVDKRGKKVDDYVVTTGIRTVDQNGGMFRLNGKPSMLNGAQIMGFREPLEKAVIWNRCPPIEWIAKELLMVKKMNGNLLRIHVHAWENSTSEGINDPRIAELADQMGIMLIWTTPSWIRTGDDWRHIDFKGLPKYMYKVFNHPSIVLWEASNHPNKFKRKGIEDSDEFCETVYNTIYPVDSSRIIAFTSFYKHMHYGNDEGSIDYRGNPVKASWAYTAPLVTRGNQDSPTGYSNDWSAIRKWGQDSYTKSVLESKERAYFNFEHQESMAQPNWELLRGKPYYRMHSYEWGYDEGTIGRRLTLDEWKESQGWQAFSAWEAMKKMRWQGYDGFSWCSLHGGPNSGTYNKPIIDMHGHAKLAYWVNKMVFQPTIAGSYNVDVVYGPDDTLTPVVIHWGEKSNAKLTITIQDADDTLVEEKVYSNISLPYGRESITLPPFKPAWNKEGYYIINYLLSY